MTHQSALNLLRRLTALGILHERSAGRGVKARWYADEVLDALGD